MTVFHIYTLNIIFRILCLLFKVYNFTMTRVWLRFIAGPDTTLHFCLLISSQLSCKIVIVYFWVHLNTRPLCVIVQNLSWNSELQDITTDHTSGLLVVCVHFNATYFIDTVKESQGHKISYVIPERFNLKLCLSNLTVYWFINESYNGYLIGWMW